MLAWFFLYFSKKKEGHFKRQRLLTDEKNYVEKL
jgi:hypothetical protein